MVSVFFYSINPTNSFKDWETDDTTPTRRQIKIFASFFLLDGVGVISRQKLVKKKRRNNTKVCVFAPQASSPRKPTSSSNQRLKQEREKVRFLLGAEERARDLRKARDLFDPNGTGTIDVTRIPASSFSCRFRLHVLFVKLFVSWIFFFFWCFKA